MKVSGENTFMYQLTGQQNFEEASVKRDGGSAGRKAEPESAAAAKPEPALEPSCQNPPWMKIRPCSPCPSSAALSGSPSRPW